MSIVSIHIVHSWYKSKTRFEYRFNIFHILTSVRKYKTFFVVQIELEKRLIFWYAGSI